MTRRRRMVSGRWATGLLLGLGMASAAAVSVGAEPDRTLPDFETVRSSFRSSETLLLDRLLYLIVEGAKEKKAEKKKAEAQII